MYLAVLDARSCKHVSIGGRAQYDVNNTLPDTVPAASGIHIDPAKLKRKIRCQKVPARLFEYICLVVIVRALERTNPNQCPGVVCEGQYRGSFDASLKPNWIDFTAFKDKRVAAERILTTCAD